MGSREVLFLSSKTDCHSHTISQETEKFGNPLKCGTVCDSSPFGFDMYTFPGSDFDPSLWSNHTRVPVTGRQATKVEQNLAMWYGGGGTYPWQWVFWCKDGRYRLSNDSYRDILKSIHGSSGSEHDCLRKYQKRDLATTSLGANMRMR